MKRFSFRSFSYPVQSRTKVGRWCEGETMLSHWHWEANLTENTDHWMTSKQAKSIVVVVVFVVVVSVAMVA